MIKKWLESCARNIIMAQACFQNFYLYKLKLTLKIKQN